MNNRILTMALSPEASNTLAALLPDSPVQSVEDHGSVQFALGQGGQGIAVLVVGPDLPADQCASIFTWVALYAPHVQCVLAVLDDHLPRVIEVKNQITSMSVVRYPWEEGVLPQLVKNLVATSAIRALEDRFMRQSLAPFAANIGQTRIVTLYHLFGLQSDGTGSERVLSFLEVAVAFRDSQVMGALQSQDIAMHAGAEGMRMAEILTHVKRWYEAFESGSPVRSLPSVFSVLNGVLMVRDIKDQFAPANGPIGATPNADQCCLLALLTWPKSNAVLKQRQDGVWLVEEAAGSTEFRSSIRQLLA